jgi:heme-degrading monooxygenase HmoA
MAVKVLIKRQFKPEHMDQATKILVRTRYAAMQMEGYIASETWRGLHDPNQITVVSMWQTPEAWNRWYTSEERKTSMMEMEPIMTDNERIEPYALGIQEIA